VSHVADRPPVGGMPDAWQPLSSPATGQPARIVLATDGSQAVRHFNNGWNAVICHALSVGAGFEAPSVDVRFVRNTLPEAVLNRYAGLLMRHLEIIYLHRLDAFVEKVLLPEYNRGVRRVHNPAYQKVQRELAKASHRGDTATVRLLRRKLRSLPTQDPCDPGYRRLRYVRYADDTLLGFTGPKAEAEEIKRRLSQFLQDELKLELNQEKTLITHARTERARLGAGRSCVSASASRAPGRRPSRRTRSRSSTPRASS